MIRHIPTANVPIAQISLMMNLGYIVKAKELASLGAAVLAEDRSDPCGAIRGLLCPALMFAQYLQRTEQLRIELSPTCECTSDSRFSILVVSRGQPR